MNNGLDKGVKNKSSKKTKSELIAANAILPYKIRTLGCVLFTYR
jgi:hypothetical protein